MGVKDWSLRARVLAAWRSRRRKASGEDFALVGRLASVEEALSPEGSVIVDGELWRARVAGRHGRVETGRLNVRVVGARGHFLEVEPR